MSSVFWRWGLGYFVVAGVGAVLHSSCMRGAVMYALIVRIGLICVRTTATDISLNQHLLPHPIYSSLNSGIQFFR